MSVISATEEAEAGGIESSRPVRKKFVSVCFKNKTNRSHIGLLEKKKHLFKKKTGVDFAKNMLILVKSLDFFLKCDMLSM
jgi:hypothetical protein